MKTVSYKNSVHAAPLYDLLKQSLKLNFNWVLYNKYKA